MPLIPKEIVDRIIAGDNALRVLRVRRGKTRLDLTSDKGFPAELDAADAVQ
jgi:hypothetical protein